MPKTTLLRARVDTTRKTKAEKILARYGLTPEQAINVFYAKVIEVGGLPFDLRPTETDELLADPAFQRHLARMKTGKVKYFDLLPDKPVAKRASKLKVAIEREGFGRNVDWSAVEKVVKERKRSRRKKVKDVRGPVFDSEGYQVGLKTLNGEPLPELEKMAAKPLAQERR